MDTATQDPPGGPALRQTASSDADAAATRRHSAEVSPTWQGKILLTDNEGAAVFGVGLRTFLELQHEAWFPRPVILGPRLKRHVRTELEAAVAQMPRQGRLAEPAQLLKSRVERAMRSGVLA